MRVCTRNRARLTEAKVVRILSNESVHKEQSKID